MTELFCKIMRKTRVLLMILLGASLAYAAIDITGMLGAYNASEVPEPFPAWPIARAVLYGPAVYAALLICSRWDAEKLTTRAAFLTALGVRAVLLLTLSAGKGGGMLPMMRDLTSLLSVSGAFLLILINRRPDNMKRLIALLSMAAMVSALATAYLAVVWTMDGEISVPLGVLWAPDALFGVILALFFGDLRQKETESST